MYLIFLKSYIDQLFSSLAYGLAFMFSSSLLTLKPYLLLRSLPYNNIGLY